MGMIAALPKMRVSASAVFFSCPGSYCQRRNGVIGVARKRLRRREIIGYLIIGIVVIGLILLVYWIVTERPCPSFPGIEKLRGGWLHSVSDVELVSGNDTAVP